MSGERARNLDGFSLDPYIVLGLNAGASAEEVREAFRLKSRKHHPDVGGDEWAFRIVVRAYEALLSATEPLAHAAGAATHAEANVSRNVQIRPGVHDRNIPAERLVLVEMVWKRYAIEDLSQLVSGRPGERSLGGSLQVIWPDPDLAGDPREIRYADRILLALNATFDAVRVKKEPISASSRIDGGRFDAYLSFPTGQTAWSAFKHLHVNLKARGLGVRQWTKDVTVPRDSS